jgi:hypothetical protein
MNIQILVCVEGAVGYYLITHHLQDFPTIVMMYSLKGAEEAVIQGRLGL